MVRGLLEIWSDSTPCVPFSTPTPSAIAHRPFDEPTFRQNSLHMTKKPSPFLQIEDIRSLSPVFFPLTGASI